MGVRGGFGALAHGDDRAFELPQQGFDQLRALFFEVTG